MRRVYELLISKIGIKILIQERITAHRECWNKRKQQQTFKVGDVIKSHIQVQAKAETGELKKLPYKV